MYLAPGPGNAEYRRAPKSKREERLQSGSRLQAAMFVPFRNGRKREATNLDLTLASNMQLYLEAFPEFVPILSLTESVINLRQAAR
jgi:hypothetical protein